MSPYGDFLSAFPELMQAAVFTKEGCEPVRAAYLFVPSKGQKVTREGHALDVIQRNIIYSRVDLSIGMQFRHNNVLMKIVQVSPYLSYHSYWVERVQGSRDDASAPLQVSEGYFE